MSQAVRVEVITLGDERAPRFHPGFTLLDVQVHVERWCTEIGALYFGWVRSDEDLALALQRAAERRLRTVVIDDLRAPR